MGEMSWKLIFGIYILILTLFKNFIIFGAYLLVLVVQIPFWSDLFFEQNLIKIIFFRVEIKSVAYSYNYEPSWIFVIFESSKFLAKSLFYSSVQK